jgi:hypothetical protein
MVDRALTDTATVTWDYSTSGQAKANVALAGLKPAAPNTQTSSYTAVLTDSASVTSAVEMNVATANTFTVPPNSSEAFPIGDSLNVVQYGAGQTTVTPGSGVTVRAAVGLKTRAQYSMVTLYKRATDEWVCGGDTSA